MFTFVTKTPDKEASTDRDVYNNDDNKAANPNYDCMSLVRLGKTKGKIMKARL